MVFFTCQHCGESLKKPVVEKHYQIKCFNQPFVTCVDCLKDFQGMDFKQHTECLTELERYSAKGFVAKPPGDKGKIKQLQWVDLVQQVLNSKNLNPPERRLLELCSLHSNIPRKEGKFINFVNNITKRNTDIQTIKSVFNVIKTIELNKQVENGSCNPIKKDEVNDEKCFENDNENKQEIRRKKSLNCTENNFTEEKSNNECDENKDIQKLTKKELKKKKKHEKYLAELQSVEFNIQEKNDDEPARKKKNKKNVADTISIENCTESESSREMTSNLLKKKRKKSDVENDVLNFKIPCKKQKQTQLQDNLSSIGESQEECESKPERSFSWNDTIIQILQNQESKEMPLKKLRKKVIAEYHTVKNGHKTHDQLLAKFSKSVNKTIGVRVLKERAKLIL